MKRTKFSSSDSPTRHDANNKPLFIVIGTSVVAVTLLVSVIGVHSVISSIQRNSVYDSVEIQQYIADQIAKQSSQNQYQAEQTVHTESKPDKVWTSDQLDWARENHITWGEDGLPRNPDGDVMDDPTTDVDETTKVSSKPAEAAGTTGTETSPESANQNWWEGNPEIQVDDKGLPYYVVKPGDHLSKIALMTGFTVPELADYNNITTPSMIYTGNVIRFPEAGPSIADATVGLG